MSPNKQPFPISTSHHLLASTSLLSGYLSILHFSYKWNHTLYYLLCLTSFTKHNILRFVHILVCMIPFWPNICMCVGVGVHMYYFLFTHSCVAEHFSWFQLLAINNAAMNILLQWSFNVFSKYVLWNIFGIYLAVELLNCMIILYLIFEELSTVSTMLSPVFRFLA